jgi:hypothetical protein
VTDEAPLSDNEKALVISVFVIGALVVLMGLYVIASSVYALQTGKVMGGNFSRSMMSITKDERGKEAVEKQLAASAEVQKKWAPWQLTTELTYLATWGVMIFAGIAMMTHRPGRRRIAVGALAGIAARLAVGVVTWLLTAEMTEVATASIMQNPALSSEKMAGMREGMSAAMRGITALSAACMAIVICGYLAVVAGVFLKVPQPKPAPVAPVT